MAILKDEYVIDGMKELRESMAEFQKELDREPAYKSKQNAPTLTPTSRLPLALAFAAGIVVGAIATFTYLSI